jgi:lipid A 3-O-deacylase
VNGAPVRPAVARKRPAVAALLLSVLVAAFPRSAPAGEIVIGLGADDIARSASAAGSIEVRTDPLWQRAVFGRLLSVAMAVAGEIDADRDLWAGIGPLVLYALDARWRLEASVLPGVYSQGSQGTDLGRNAPIIRSSLGASYAVTPIWRLGASLSHKSNANTAQRQPGHRDAAHHPRAPLLTGHKTFPARSGRSIVSARC